MPLVDDSGLRARLREVAAERDWERFHTPKNLAMALTGEVGELLAELQWLTDEQIGAALVESPPFRRAMSNEMADVLIYLVRLADVVGIDLDEAVVAKLAENARRPAG